MASPGPLRAGLKKALSPHNAAPPAKLAKLEPSSKASLGLGTLDSSDDDCSWGPSQPAEAATGAGPLTQLAAAGSGQVSRAFCPHCSCYLPDVGGGSAGAGAAHVAACGQGAGQAAEEAGEDSEGNWSEAEEEGVGAEGLEEGGDPAEGPSAEEEGLLEEEEGEPEEAEPQEQQQSEVGAWLASHGLERFAPNFERAGAEAAAGALAGPEPCLAPGRHGSLGWRRRRGRGPDRLTNAAASSFPPSSPQARTSRCCPT